MPRSLRRIALPLLFVFLQLSLAAPTAAASGRERSGLGQHRAPTAVLRGLERWIGAVAEHEPGERDAALALVSPWTGADLGSLLAEGLLPLLRECGRSVRDDLRTAAGVSAPRRRGGRLTDAELSFVRMLSDRLCRVEGGLVRETPPGAIDHLLRGGAILHGDVAMTALPDPETGEWPAGEAPRLPSAGSGARMSMLDDGTQTLVPNSAAAHWAMARLLLDQLRADPSDAEPAPARDPMVRSWYRATLAFMAAVPYVDTTHLERAEELFGDDSVVHLLIGSMHEWMASDAVQRAIQVANRPTLMGEPRGRPRVVTRFPVGSTRAELRRARGHFERAVRLDPALAEARLRHGRVLALTGNHQEAAVELRRAVAADPGPPLAYYANLFLGAEEEALGRLTEAGEAYHRAAALHPEAPTPRLALSHLMRRQGNHDEAFRLIRLVLAPGNDPVAAADPMRRYARSAGRRVKELLRDMVRLYLEAAPAGGQRAAEMLQ